MSGTREGLHLLMAIGDKTQAEADLRRRLYQTMIRYPGLHAAELARQAQLPEPSARYHLHVMTRLGLANEVEERGYLRFYPAKALEGEEKMPLGRHEKAALAVMRRPVPLRIVLALIGEDGPRPMGWVAENSGVSNGTATYHVKNLAKASVVAVEQKHRQRIVGLRDRDWTLRLLTQYPPPRDVVEGFVELWDNLEL